MNAFLDRPLTGDWPYLRLDATYLRQREGGRIVSVAAIIAVAVDGEGWREIVGLHIGPSEAETFWSTFLKGLVKRGLQGVNPRIKSGEVISEAHEGLNGAIRRVMGANAAWQRCSVHWLRNALAHMPKTQQTMVAAGLRQALLQPDQEGAHRVRRTAAAQFRTRWPKLAALMDDSEHDVLAFMAFPVQHRAKLRSTNPSKRLNKEVKRRADVPRVGLRPPEDRLRHLSRRGQHHQADRRGAARSE